MREIKFRGVCNETGRLIYGFYSAIPNEHIMFYNDNNEVDVCPIKIDTLGQYTGFKDKNGVDIYEGDILIGNFEIKTGERVSIYKRQRSTYAVYSDLTVTGVASVISGCWYFNSNFKVEYQTGFYRGCGVTKAEKKANESVTTYSTANEMIYKVLKKLEVVGNIHQNPELLKEVTT